MGKTKWDVIHFNFGIWDTHFLINGGVALDRSKYKAEDLKRRFTTEQYIENLSKVIVILKKTGATLIWASTTPFVSYGDDTKLLLEANNKAAKALMEKEGIMIDDLHSLALPNLKEWQSKDGCHMTPTGDAQLAKQVAASITEALDKKPNAAKTPANASGR